MAPWRKASFFSLEAAAASLEAVMTVQTVLGGPGPEYNRAALQTSSFPMNLGHEEDSRAALMSLPVDTNRGTLSLGGTSKEMLIQVIQLTSIFHVQTLQDKSITDFSIAFSELMSHLESFYCSARQTDAYYTPDPTSHVLIQNVRISESTCFRCPMSLHKF